MKIAAELSGRQQHVLGLILRGSYYREIADELHISVDTVKVHASRAYRKLGVANFREAALVVNKRATRGRDDAQARLPM